MARHYNEFTGKFIVLYGSNNIGKSTQMHMLAKKLIDSKNEIAYIKYPLYNQKPTGPIIDEILRHSQMSFNFDKNEHEMLIAKLLKLKGKVENIEGEVQKLYAQNRRDFQDTLKGMLKAGITVLAEDYVGTGIAWGMTRNVELEYLEKINKDLLKPDCAILMDGERIMSGMESNHRNESNGNEIWNKSREIYQGLADRYEWIKVDANGDIETVHKRIYDALVNHLNK